MISGQRADGCLPCPRGRYGNAVGLKSSACTAPCPAGKYGNMLAAKSIYECVDCPAGRYGTTVGLTTPKCSGNCPIGTYSGVPGISNVAVIINLLYIKIFKNISNY